MKILLAVDGAAYTKRMMTYVAAHGVQHGLGSLRNRASRPSVHRVGPAAATIAKLGQRRFDLVIMGSQGGAAISGLVLVSIATWVLGLCATPVMPIR